MENTFSQGTPEISITQEDVILSGDIAVARGNYVLTIIPEEGDPVVLNGKYLNVVRRQMDGTWKLAHNMFSSNDPLPE